MSDALVIRDARLGDEDAILVLLFEFAQFERLTEKFRLTRERIARDFIGRERRVQCDVAEWDGAIAGVMIWYRSYATFAASPGIYLEDLFVRPAQRGRGIGKALLANLAQQCVANSWSRLQWSVLDWNTPSIEFYKSLGAVLMDEWTVCRVSGPALTALAQGTR